MARRLKTLADEINRVPGYRAVLERGYCNTDRKVGRLRSPGKGRWGTRLIVYGPGGEVVLDHNSAEAYRRNSEVEDWLAYLLEHGTHRKFFVFED